MTNELMTREDMAAIVERVVLAGDLAKLQPADRVAYYQQTCESLGLNPLTRPFEYIVLNGKLQLYARKDATEQLRTRHGVSVVIAARELVEGIYVVTARATTASGRTDESIGAVPVEGLKGEAKANAFMKAETKAKRRVTLSICGLGMLDENEVTTIPGATFPAINDYPVATQPGATYAPSADDDDPDSIFDDDDPAPAAPCCPVHGTPYEFRQGTNTKGKAWKRWSCPTRLDDGKWCQMGEWID